MVCWPTPLPKVRLPPMRARRLSLRLEGTVSDADAPTFDPAILDVAPLLGVCYGMQWLALQAGAAAPVAAATGASEDDTSLIMRAPAATAASSRSP